jgi:hypothetical protein
MKLFSSLAVIVIAIILLFLIMNTDDGDAQPKVVAQPMKIASAAENPKPQAWWVRRQIEVATILGKDGDAQGTDPWPNCPDPYDHQGHTWRHTLKCENRAYAEIYGVWDPRAWKDSPGYFRCGLQFEPRWERRYGKLCP